MDESSSASPAPPAPSSFSSRATNVFASPQELYSEVAVVPVQSSSWSFPYILGMVIALLFTVALFNNAALRQEIFDAQLEQLRKAVDDGRITQEQYEQQATGMESVGAGLFIAIGGISAIVMLTIMFFGIPLILWLAAKFILKFSGGYKKILEVYGLATLIGSLGAIVTLLLMYVFNTMVATPSAALALIGSFDKTSFTHMFLSQLNIFTLWQTAVVGMGLSKLTGKSTGMSMGVVFGLWLVWAVLSSAFGWGMR